MKIIFYLSRKTNFETKMFKYHLKLKHGINIMRYCSSFEKKNYGFLLLRKTRYTKKEKCSCIMFQNKCFRAFIQLRIIINCKIKIPNLK